MCQREESSCRSTIARGVHGGVGVAHDRCITQLRAAAPLCPATNWLVETARHTCNHRPTARKNSIRARRRSFEAESAPQATRWARQTGHSLVASALQTRRRTAVGKFSTSHIETAPTICTIDATRQAHAWPQPPVTNNRDTGSQTRQVHALPRPANHAVAAAAAPRPRACVAGLALWLWRCGARVLEHTADLGPRSLAL